MLLYLVVVTDGPCFSAVKVSEVARPKGDDAKRLLIRANFIARVPISFVRRLKDERKIVTLCRGIAIKFGRR